MVLYLVTHRNLSRYFIYSLCITCSIEKISSCSEAVKYLQRLTSLVHVDDDLVDEHSINHIEVRRDFIVKDALKEAKKQKFL